MCGAFRQIFRQDSGDRCKSGRIIEPIWELCICSPFEHQSDETQIEFRRSMAERSLEVFDQTLTALSPGVRPFNHPPCCHQDKSRW